MCCFKPLRLQSLFTGAVRNIQINLILGGPKSILHAAPALLTCDHSTVLTSLKCQKFLMFSLLPTWKLLFSLSGPPFPPTFSTQEERKLVSHLVENQQGKRKRQSQSPSGLCEPRGKRLVIKGLLVNVLHSSDTLAGALHRLMC